MVLVEGGGHSSRKVVDLDRSGIGGAIESTTAEFEREFGVSPDSIRLTVRPKSAA